ncbi:beta-galactosidase-1-like protein 3 isoform X2 [Chrysoperla carnea]|nr:beta-galactosidase-1-like protein 3 isoform X2 [Chrysoperla carnea]XP_044739509.1 beta-galactosidase-1-like protein 3 isoform X2 [Chrysoperla carnea]
MALVNSALPTLYQHYTTGGIVTGLNADTPQFTLNNRNITIFSGAMHYFRVPRKYWRDRLRKMRAAGLNAVETYVPWNLHEPEPGKYDFGEGGTDFEDFLHVQEYLKIAQEEDLLAIVRPGPFICAEWEFGGLPSWLLREKDIKVRTSDSKFMAHVTRFFNVLIPLLAALQFSKGGPIIAVQVENEYGSTGSNDKPYLRQLKNLLQDNGIVELLVTSDGPFSAEIGTLPGEVLQTINFNGNAVKSLDNLRKIQPNRPLMTMEYWTGWFDHWSESHHTVSTKNFRQVYLDIISYPASVSMYMFHGGTSFGFLNGANMEGGQTDNGGLQPDTTSYDYDAPLTESGDYTEKYEVVVELVGQYNPEKTLLPDRPSETPKIVYNSLEIIDVLEFSTVLSKIDGIPSKNVVSMEELPINNNSGQSYGYIVYQKKNLNIRANSVLKIQGRVCDTLIVLINGQRITEPLLKADQLKGFGYWKKKDGELNLGSQDYENATLELIVENWGRNNFGGLNQFNQKKGLWQGDVLLNNSTLENWTIYPLEFRSSWTNSLSSSSSWKRFSDYKQSKNEKSGPILLKTILKIDNPVADTFIDLRDWVKGIVVVNGFVLGRYSIIGPQYFLYLPAPLLKSGDNEIIIFEHFTPSSKLSFSKSQIFNKKK